MGIGSVMNISLKTENIEIQEELVKLEVLG